MTPTRTAKTGIRASTGPPEGGIIEFLRKRDYAMVRELGQGACGKTVLLYDEEIQEHVVCKKYMPFDESARVAYYQRFVREIKLLYQLHHPNIVRYFHHYLYPQFTTGYILMEYIDGQDIGDYIKAVPERTSDLFLQAIDGFAYLEAKGIMHRDIRPANILVTKDGRLKIIDLGFGKHTKPTDDFHKSISLNWYGEAPAEFLDGRYDFATEVYFLGKLFERLIQDQEIEQFAFKDTLRGMCAHHHHERPKAFSEIQQRLRTLQIDEIGFSRADLEGYRQFATLMSNHVTKIAQGAKYHTDVDRIITQLTDVHRRSMLEVTLPDAATVIRCFLNGGYYYRKAGFPTSIVTEFLELLKRSSSEQRKIIIANLHTKLDALGRYDPTPDSDVPF